MRKLLVLMVVVVAAAAVALTGGTTLAGEKGPIKVGFLTPHTGPLSANGKDMVNGLQQFLEEQNYRLAGREIKLLQEDTEA